jgi:hypothetical protein
LRKGQFEMKRGWDERVKRWELAIESHRRVIVKPEEERDFPARLLT